MNLLTKWFRNTFKRKAQYTMRYDCARVYVGKYMTGGNESFREVVCAYTVVSGEVSRRELKPVVVKGTNESDTGLKNYKLNTVMLYPKSETALVNITNGKQNFRVQLVRKHRSRRTVFKLRL
jgi:hypothetical protein